MHVVNDNMKFQGFFQKRFEGGEDTPYEPKSKKSQACSYKYISCMDAFYIIMYIIRI